MSSSALRRGLRVLISGAGIGGPALAFWLRRYGFFPTLVERAPAFRDGGYMIDVWGLGWDLIDRMGLLDAARHSGYVIDRLEFVDEGGRCVSGFDAGVFRRALGGRSFSIPRGDLARLIYDSDRVRDLPSRRRIEPDALGSFGHLGFAAHVRGWIRPSRLHLKQAIPHFTRGEPRA